VLAAIDATAADETHRALNTHILEMAVAVAEQASAELHLVHAWRKTGADALKAAGIVPQGEEDWRQTYSRVLDGLLRGHRIDHERAHVHLVEGKASEVIPALAQSHDIDLIVMGTVSRTGISGFLIGNTAESVLQRVNCSVLAVKPPGFVTPVDLA
jgi:nucleotide-binding universal stress UspA family protein